MEVRDFRKIGAIVARIVCWLTLDLPVVVRRSRVDASTTRRATADVDALIVRSVERFGGTLFQHFHLESSVLAAFVTASSCVEAACALQRELIANELPARMAVFLGEQSDPDTVMGDVLTTAESLRNQAVEGSVVVDAGCVPLVGEEPCPEAAWRTLGPSDSTMHTLVLIDHPDLVSESTDSFRKTRLDNLPRHLTAFLGREPEVEELLARFYLSRIVTIVGSGGIGKTRLAIQVAHRSSDSQAEGTWWVDARGVTHVDDLADRLLQALPRPTLGEADPRERLVQTLRTRQAMLLIDNAEDDLESVRALVEAVGQACPNIAFLITSRQPLSLLGESVFRLGPLDASASDAPAMRLFLDRITISNPEFEPSATQVKSIQTICRAVDGIPLAIEIAAGLYPGHTIAHIERTVTQSMLEMRSSKTGKASLQAVLAWGYETLKKSERSVLEAVSVFPVRFNLAEAEVAAGSSKQLGEILDRLVSASVLQREGDDYRWLMPMRQFAQKKLKESGQEDSVRERVSHWALEEVESLYERPGTQRDAWLDVCARLHSLLMELIEPMLKRAIKDDTPIRFVYGLYDYYLTRGPYVMGEALARRLYERSAGRPAIELIRLKNMSGILRMQQGRFRDASVDLHDALHLSRQLESPLLEGRLLSNYALALCRIPRYREAAEAAEASLKLTESVPGVHASSLVNAASVWLAQGNIDRVEELLSLLDAMGERTDQIKLTRSVALLHRKRASEAQPLLEESLVAFIKAHDMRSTLAALSHLVESLAAQGVWHQAAALLGLADRISESFICWLYPHTIEAVQAAREQIHAKLGEEAETEFSIGRELTLEELAQFLVTRGAPNLRIED